MKSESRNTWMRLGEKERRAAVLCSVGYAAAGVRRSQQPRCHTAGSDNEAGSWRHGGRTRKGQTVFVCCFFFSKPIFFHEARHNMV